MVRRSLVLLASLALVAIAATPVVAKNPNAVNAYRVSVLQSNATDASLVNGWGIVSGPATPWWVSNNGTDTSTLYNGTTGAKIALTVAVAGGPTGVVFNGASAFPVTPGGTNFARFIFATLDGTVQAWTGGLTASVVRAHGARRRQLHRARHRHGRDDAVPLRRRLRERPGRRL